jgi:hypothetical protein
VATAAILGGLAIGLVAASKARQQHEANGAQEPPTLMSRLSIRPR